MNTVIAATKVLIEPAGEPPIEVTLEIGTPYQVGADPDEWACPVSLVPLYKKLHDAHAGDPFQALCLASSLALDLLHGVKEKGGSVLLAPGEPFPFEAYAFGSAVRGGNGGA